MTEPNEHLELLKAADVFFGRMGSEDEEDYDPKWERMLNLNDTFAWACADCQYVSDEDLPRVAHLFREYGMCGIYYWVAVEKRGWQLGVIEFLDIRRMVQFVMNEEAITKEEPRSSARAYLRREYVIGATDG